MSLFTVTLSMPSWIERGVANGTYELVGGVVRRADTKQVVAWLREAGAGQQVSTGVLNLLPSVGAAASILNLGVTTMGFAVVLQRLHGLEQRLLAAQAILQQIDQKLDIGFYANFRAALDLAVNAFMMTSGENRKASALQAINRFAEARHHYTALADAELERRSQVIDEYLSTLALAYVAEARCYLELEERDTAQRLLEQGVVVLRSRGERFVAMLLTSNPAIFLHPSLKGQIDLRRLTRVFQWLNPELDENAVFDRLREDVFDLARQSRKWIDALPPAVWDVRVDLQGRGVSLPILKRNWNPKVDLQKRGISLPGAGRDVETRVYERLPVVLETVESVIEDVRRFQGYLLEVQTIRQLGVSFGEWQHVLPSPDFRSDDSGLMCIALSQPLDLV